MNRLDVRCERQTNEDGGTYYDVSFFVDDLPFLDVVQEFESCFAGDLAGSYTNIYFGSYTEDFLLGHQLEYGEQGNKTELLGCTCGCSGCWPLATRIEVVGQTVVWKDF